LSRNNIAVPLTKDHKPHWPEEKKRIEALGGQIYFDGGDWRIKDLSVSKSFGDLDSVPYVTHKPDIFKYKLSESEEFIVLACDGLWDVMTNQDVVNFILQNKPKNLKKDSDKITHCKATVSGNLAKKLADYAIEIGSTDNITVIIIFM